MMKCTRCEGRIFIDRIFSSGFDFEVSCLHCGERKFIPLETPQGKVFEKREKLIARIQNGLA